jgi:hypothetical protein
MLSTECQTQQPGIAVEARGTKHYRETMSIRFNNLKNAIIHNFLNEWRVFSDRSRCFGTLAGFSSERPQTVTSDPESSQTDGLALDAAAVFVLSDDCLDVVRAGAACLVFAGGSVKAVRLIVAALEKDQAFEAHCDSLI